MGFLVAIITVAFMVAIAVAAARYSRQQPKRAVVIASGFATALVIALIVAPDFVLTAVLPWTLMAITLAALGWAIWRLVPSRATRP
jgi:hypothetical protein